MGYRILVSPELICVERNGARSALASLTAQDGQAEVRAKAAELYETIKRAVAYVCWVRHRIAMVAMRALADRVLAAHPGPWFPGQRPDLIATKPWRQARIGEWVMLPRGVARRILRGAAPVEVSNG